jgi:hypothetical protein
LRRLKPKTLPGSTPGRRTRGTSPDSPTRSKDWGEPKGSPQMVFLFLVGPRGPSEPRYVASVGPYGPSEYLGDFASTLYRCLPSGFAWSFASWIQECSRKLGRKDFLCGTKESLW